MERAGEGRRDESRGVKKATKYMSSSCVANSVLRASCTSSLVIFATQGVLLVFLSALYRQGKSLSKPFLMLYHIRT